MLSDSQRDLLAARLRKGRAQKLGGIPRRVPGVEVPLSFGQEQLWFIDQFAPGLATYNVAGGLRMRGPLNVHALGKALEALVARHEALRTRLVSGVDGRPLQEIDELAEVPLPVVDLSDLEIGVRETRLRELAIEEGARPFSLADGPLLRLRLFRLAEDEHLLEIVVHHTVFDGWSFEVLQRELAVLYESEVLGTPSKLAEMPIQFADYALWERERLQGEVLDGLVEYWRERLDGVQTVHLATDRRRPVLASFDGGLERVPMGAAVLDGLQELSRREGTTLFVTLLAALQVLLHRYTGQDDIVVGTASANRTREELAPLIGFLVNTLPIRTDMSGDPTFVELLSQVRDTTVAAYAHQDLPFAKLVEALRVERDPSRAPLFQIGFTQANIGEKTPVADLVVQAEPVDMLPAKFDLNLFAKIGPDGLAVDASYAKALFDAATVRRMLGNFRVLLGGIVADPTKRLSELPLLTQEEYHREVVEWNDTAVEFPVVCIHSQFETQVRHAPDGIAAVHGEESVTYAELNRQANRIARWLRDKGAGPEVLVGVCMPPSIRRLAVLLGIMKAGSGYVPLDPALPPERLSYMVGDARMPVVVTDSAGPSLPGDAEVVSIDEAWPAVSELPDTNLEVAVEPSNLAYVIYTSGSTGQPKGVMVEHRHAINFLIGMIEHFPIRPGDQVLQFASLSFDVSVMDMFMTLLSGATAVLANRETLMSPPRLGELLRDRKVTFACLPPAVVNLLTGEDFPDLRILLSAGEELSSTLVRSWLRPGLRFHNGYGPTEAAIGATFMELDGTMDPPPIGRPKPNYQAYVLDAHLNPVPVGVIGELHIGGAGVTRGYLNQPELTAQRFIDDPFRPGGRLYKTGDLVRRRPDGLIQFVGRIDDQVKIRGLRVEPGEIETAMVSMVGVAQAFVTVIEDRAGEKQLVGYARAAENGKVSPADLRQHLTRWLPAYMVPTHLVVLDTFPLTPNGKIDKSALPEPGAGDTTTLNPPTTLIETMLVDLYAGLLNNQVGVDDSFFDTGGNSLQAMQLITRLRNELAVDIDVTAVFLAPTPRRLTEVLVVQHGLEDVELGEDGIEGLEGFSDPAASLN
ncbi:MAG TPA: amino acid adenylation domain-containing protein [Actinophytocola sp.]